MAVTGAVLRSAFVQFSSLMCKRGLITASQNLLLSRCGSLHVCLQNPTLANTNVRNISSSTNLVTNSPALKVTSPTPDWSLVSQSKDILSKIESKLGSEDMGRLFAVVHICGKQRKVTTEDIIIVEHEFPPNVGDQIRLEKVLLVGSKDFSLLGSPMLSRDQVYIDATVVEKTLSHHKTLFKQIPRKRHRRFKLERCMQTMLVINSIRVNNPK